jgi:hypothetical protein
VHTADDVVQIQIHTPRPLVPDPSHTELELATGNLKKYRSRGSDHIRAKLLNAGNEIFLSAIHKIINSICKEEELPDQ